MQVFKLAFWAIVFFTALLIFGSLAGENQDPVHVTLFNHTSPPYQKWVVLMSSFFLGAIVATLFFVVQFVILETKFIRLKRSHKQMERALAKHEETKSEPLSSLGAGPSAFATSSTPTPSTSISPTKPPEDV